MACEGTCCRHAVSVAPSSGEPLENMMCEVCRTGAPALTDREIAAYRPQVPDWRIVVAAGTRQLERVFRFKDFADAMAFTIRVGKLAENEGHHPAVLTEWGRVTVTWWTHKIKGLHINDFVMARRTDMLYGS